MVDSGTNAIIVPLHPRMQGEIAECQAPSATVTGPIVQVYEHNGARRSVVALPNSAILVSQVWLTTVAGWSFFSGPKPGLKNSACENKVYPAGADASFVLNMKNGLPYLSKELYWRAVRDIARPVSVKGAVLESNARHSSKGYAHLRTYFLSKELFWRAMRDIARKAMLISGHTWEELKGMTDNHTYEPQPQMYSVKTVAVLETPKVLFSATPRARHFNPGEIRRRVVEWFEHLHTAANPNRGRLSGTAQSLTFGAQTGRGSDRSCVIKRTTDHKYDALLSLVHELAQNAVGPMLPYPI